MYGLWVNAQQELLLVDERIKGRDITKFPGGGMEFGEGVIDCLYREWQEEIGQPILTCRHFYTTDFFQQSAYNPMDQIVSIYYLVHGAGTGSVVPPEGEILRFRWVSLSTLSPEMLTLPIDRKAAALLLAEAPVWPPMV